MNYKPPPSEIIVKGKSYPIPTDFRVWLDLNEQFSNVSDKKEILNIFISFLVKNKLPVYKEAIDEILVFFNCGEKLKEENKSNQRKKEKYIDFKVDEELIFSAFISQYSIDLRRDTVHWWDFIAMFSGLNEDHKISKIISYRAIDLKNVSKQSREHYRKLKAKYSLKRKNHITLEERDQILLNRVKEIQKRVMDYSKKQ